MERPGQPAFLPGGSILGGAAAGLSYEGALRDAVSGEEKARRREVGQARKMAAPQLQAKPPKPDRER